MVHGYVKRLAADFADLVSGYLSGLGCFSDHGTAAVVLDIASGTMRSIALDISHKSTEFTFQADERSSRRQGKEKSTAHNAIIDCHRDVWTRFPVIPAVQRQKVKSANRLPLGITFESHLDTGRFSRYFLNMIESFENFTRKPIGGVLDQYEISELTYRALLKRKEQEVSMFKAGEWLVDTL